jgi:glycosyltransferase involved in cell wall biosynthesis
MGLRGVPGVMGGVESHCEQIFPRLLQLSSDYDVTIIGRRGYIAPDAYEYCGINVVPLPAMRNKYLEAITNTILAVFYARFFIKAELVHIHGIGPALLGPLVRLLGMKLVVTHHGQDFEREKWSGFAKAVLRLGEQCALRASNRVIVVSKSVTEELRRRYLYREASIHYIPNGTTELAADANILDEEEAAQLRSFGLEPGKYIVGVGRLVPEKGFHLLIEAYTRANAACKLAIVGKADHEDEYSRRLIAQGGDRIVFCGFQKHQVLRTLYRHAALFVLASTHEGLPIAALEAAKLNVPILLSDIRPNLDIGLAPENYFESGNSKALAAKLLQNYATFRVDADDVCRRFNWSSVAEATQRVYAGLVAI